MLKVLSTYIKLRAEIHATNDIFDADSAGRSISSMLTGNYTVFDDEKGLGESCQFNLRKAKSRQGHFETYDILHFDAEAHSQERRGASATAP